MNFLPNGEATLLTLNTKSVHCCIFMNALNCSNIRCYKHSAAA